MELLRARLRDIAAREMATDAAHDIAHLDRVWQSASEIAATLPEVNQRVLLAACYLHDLINLPKNNPNRARASTLAAEAAEPHLTALGYTTDEITQTQHAIAAHSFSAGIEPESGEARVLRDADRLDAIGAIGIARAFAVSGMMQTQLYDPDDPFATTRPLDDKRFALDHWQIKLLRLSAGMLTEGGKRLARQRKDKMIAFLTNFAQEIGHPMPASLAQND